MLVGLAGASIVLWVIFAVRRRRRTRRIEHDSAVSATLAAAGFRRTPLDDDDEEAGAGGGALPATAHSTHSASALANPRASWADFGGASTMALAGVGAAAAAAGDAHRDSRASDDDEVYNPYTDYVVPAGSRPGYVHTPPPPGSGGAGAVQRDSGTSSSAAGGRMGHAPSGSDEPLLGGYDPRASAASSGVLDTALAFPGTAGGATFTPAAMAPPIPPRSPRRVSAATARTVSTRRTTSQAPPMQEQDVPLIDLAGLDGPGPDLALSPDGAARGAGGASVYSTGSGAFDPFGDHSGTDGRLEPGLGLRAGDGRGTLGRELSLRDEEDYSRRVLGVRFYLL